MNAVAPGVPAANEEEDRHREAVGIRAVRLHEAGHAEAARKADTVGDYKTGREAPEREVSGEECSEKWARRDHQSEKEPREEKFHPGRGRVRERRASR